MVGLQPARYKEAAAYRTISRYRDMKRHDISISLLGYDMITSHIASTVAYLGSLAYCATLGGAFDRDRSAVDDLTIIDHFVQ